jgi:hypothetical protein
VAVGADQLPGRIAFAMRLWVVGLALTLARFSNKGPMLRFMLTAPCPTIGWITQSSLDILPSI